MRALEILLERRWILKSREKELYYQIKDELGTVKKFLMEKLGYQVIVNPYLVKVEKMPATPENWMGIQEFTRKIEYVFFCMILMFLEEKEAEEQFVLSELTEYIQGQYREEQIDWTVYQYRRHLIKVIKYCVNCGILNLNDGSEENFARDDTSEVLYENTGVSRYFMKNFTQDIMGYTTPEDQAEKESLSDSDTVKLKQREVEIKSQLEGLKKNITGKVFVTFVINKDGEPVDFKIAKSVDPLLDREAIRVLQLMPNWKPGTQRGKPVSVEYTVPINFQLQ